MPAGSAQIAFREETGFLEPDTEGTWYQPGLDVTVTPEIDNELTRNRQPDDTMPAGSREGNAILSLDVEFTMTDDNWLSLLPFDGGSLSGGARLAPTAEWYLDTKYVDTDLAIDEDFITFGGAAVESATVNFNDGEDVTVSLSILAADLVDSEADTIEQPSIDDVFTQHSVDLEIGGRTQESMQTATLSMNSLARRQEQQERTPRAMVVGGIEAELESDALFTQVDQLELAAGGSTTSVGDLIDGEDGTLSFENAQADVVDFNLTHAQPANYSWNALVDPETSLSEAVTYHLRDVGI